MKKNKLPSLVSILILTLLTSIVWISLSVYRAFTSKPTESVPQEVSLPITPTLDQTAISQIESGIYLTGSEIPDNVASLTNTTNNTATPLPSPIVTPVASPNAGQ